MSGKIFKNASSLLLVQVLNPLLGMAFVIALARIDGAASLGIYTFAITMVNIFENIAGLGLREYLIREVGKDPSQWRALHNGAMIAGLVAALFAQFVMLAFAKIAGYDAETVSGLFTVSFSLVPAVMLYVFVSFLYAFDHMAITSVIFIVETIVRTILGLLIVSYGLGMHWLLLSFTCSRIIAATLAGWAQTKHLGWAGRVWNRHVLRDMLKAVPTFAAMAILATVYWRLNIVILTKMCDVEAVGHYSAGYRLMDLIAFTGGSLLTAIYPAMARFFHHHREDFKRLLDKSLQYTIAVYLPIAVAVYELSPKIITLFFGENFAAAVEALRILAWVTLPLILANLFANTLIIAGRQDLDLRINAYRLAWNLVLSYVLIAQFGMIGACGAILLSTIAAAVLQFYYLRDIAAPSLSFAQLLKPCIAVIAMMLGLKLANTWALLPQILLAAAAYCTVYLMMKPFDIEDRRLFHSLGRVTATA